jgi:biopolymer transport protein ExbD
MPLLRRAFLKAAHRPNHLYCHIDPIPYLALALVLICFFMCQPMMNPRVAIYQPVAKYGNPEPGAIKEDAIRVSVLRDGQLVFRKSFITAEVLPNRIRDATLNGAERRIYLIVDARARHEDVQRALAMIQSSGVEDVSFLVESRKQTQF